MAINIMNNGNLVKYFVMGNTNIKNSNESMFVEDNVIYSYGYHFPLAIRLTDNEGFKFIVNSNRYSPTTSKHRGMLIRAIGGYKDNVIKFADTNELKRLVELKVKEVKEVLFDALEVAYG